MKPRLILFLVVLASCSGCGTLVSHMYGRTEPYAGVRADCWQIGQGNPWFIADLPLSGLADTLLLPVDLAGQRPPPDPLKGWKHLGSSDIYHPKPAIAEDVRNYIKKQKFPHQPFPGDISFYEDGTGQHAVQISMAFDGKHRRYVLIYDKFNVRMKTMKFVVGRYMS